MTQAKPLIYLSFLTCLSSLFFWLIFYFKIPPKIGFPPVSLETLYSNYDGSNYLAISKCLYDKNCLAKNYSLPQPLEYYPAHLPAYPLIIKFFDLFTTGPKAMLLATLSGSIFLSLIFYQFLKLFLSPKESFWLSCLLLFFPARFFVLRQVGAPETWFIAATLASLYLFLTKKYWPSALFAVLAQWLKTPGIILFAAYGLHALFNRHQWKKYLPYVFVPLSIIPIFTFYHLQLNDFWAYFHSGDNFHLNPLPYLTFISTKSWLGTIWLEDIIYIYLLTMLAVYYLYRQFKTNIIFLYALLFLLASLLVAHRDISRYISPLYPLALLAFAPFLGQRPVKKIFLFLIPAIILYAVNFVAFNTAPVANWAPYL